MTPGGPRDRLIDLGLDAGIILDAVVVGMESSETSLFDLESALRFLDAEDDGLIAGALTIIATLFNERGTLPHEIRDRAPRYVTEIAFQDLE